MKKNKKVMVLRSHIDFIKDGLPREDYNAFVAKDPDQYIPSKLTTKEEKNEEADVFTKKAKKVALRFTVEEVKTSMEEDKKSLKDVKKLENHLKEDIEKANKKLKLYFSIFR
jgi:uncharacterized secreted protein with C-terminal beta-propeller domain